MLFSVRFTVLSPFPRSRLLFFSGLTTWLESSSILFVDVVALSFSVKAITLNHYLARYFGFVVVSRVSVI